MGLNLITIYYIKLKSHLSIRLHFFGSVDWPWLYGSMSDLLDTTAMSSGIMKFIFKSF